MKTNLPLFTGRIKNPEFHSRKNIEYYKGLSQSFKKFPVWSVNNILKGRYETEYCRTEFQSLK
jgi:hypothetical protein